ncbi:MAG: 50S ribosomal protein L17 [Candidatus Liptonbacteria bacterium]|nr:50S ribosomal protein L17 [Candidatus Liptonbacteria bacterium]
MRHRKKGKKFHRLTGRRKSFLRSLTNNLVRDGKIETTEARAKAIRPIVERMVSIAKKGDLASRRLLLSRIHDKKLVGKLIEDIAPRYKERNGGFVRVNKSAKTRKRDGTSVAFIEFV